MGRHKKSDTKEKNADDFTVDKESQLKKIGVDSLSTLDKETIAMFDIKPVGNPNKVSGNFIKGFTGKNYEESLKSAYEHMKEYNKRKDGYDKIELVNYYPQVFKGKSILVGYNKVKNS